MQLKRSVKAFLKACSLLFCQYGMTPLMHAAYKGKADMCRLLLQHGADVNCNEHEYGYTALMFAGLSGKLTFTNNTMWTQRFFIYPKKKYISAMSALH